MQNTTDKKVTVKRAKHNILKVHLHFFQCMFTIILAKYHTQKLAADDQIGNRYVAAVTEFDIFGNLKSHLRFLSYSLKLTNACLLFSTMLNM